MKCPCCGHEFANPVSAANGAKGGAVRVPKGFASARVLKKALATRKKNQRLRAAQKPAPVPAPDRAEQLAILAVQLGKFSGKGR